MTLTFEDSVRSNVCGRFPAHAWTVNVMSRQVQCSRCGVRSTRDGVRSTREDRQAHPTSSTVGHMWERRMMEGRYRCRFCNALVDEPQLMSYPNPLNSSNIDDVLDDIWRQLISSTGYNHHRLVNPNEPPLQWEYEIVPIASVTGFTEDEVTIGEYQPPEAPQQSFTIDGTFIYGEHDSGFTEDEVEQYSDTCADCGIKFLWQDDGHDSRCANCETGVVCRRCVPIHKCFVDEKPTLAERKRRIEF